MRVVSEPFPAAPRCARLVASARCALLLVAVARCAVPLAAAPPPDAAGELDPGRIEALAARLGHSASQLESVEGSALTLLDGRHVELFKAVDPATGAIVGGAFENGAPIDLRAAQREAGRRWRERHGALTPGLRARLDTLARDEAVHVAAWLDVDLSNAPERAAGNPVRRESGPRVGAATEAVGRAAAERAREEESAAVAALRRQADERRSAVRTALAPVRAAFLARAAAAGVEVEPAGDSTPLVYLWAPRDVVESIARWPGVDALYDVADRGGPSLRFARPAQNMTMVNDVGYTGAGVALSVTEGERAFFANPVLDLVEAYDGGQPYESHPTAVCGIVRSTDGTDRGLATDVELYNANGSYTVEATMSAAMDWGSTQADVLNNSFWWDGPNNPAFTAMDRHQDWLARVNYDTVVVAAGNFGNSCGDSYTPFVVSPAKGYNVIAVGNVDDVDTIGWSDDAMDGCSSFGDPTVPGGVLAKPEIAAIGSGIRSTLVTTDPAAPVGGVGSGTSYAAPMVSATAATLMEASNYLLVEPEAVKAILMATALHNVEGDSRFSGKDGAGGLVGLAAAALVERGDWSERFVDGSTTFPIDIHLFAHKGERVRFAIAWMSNPNAAYTSDPLPADLDLTAYRADGTTSITGSASGSNPFELVEFIAPESELYRFRITKFSADWSSGGTWLGTAGWSGVYRLSRDEGYVDTAGAPRTGNPFVVKPAELPWNVYWRAFAIRSSGESDHDLELASRSPFDDPGLRVHKAGSADGGTNSLDLVVVDGNHWPAADPEHYLVTKYGGAGGYTIGFSSLGLTGHADEELEILGPVGMAANEVVKVFDFFIPTSSYGRVRLLPIPGSADLAVRVFDSSPGDTGSWAQGKWSAVEARDRSTSGNATETLGVFNAGPGDYLGLVVEKKGPGEASFFVGFLPATLFADGFDGGDTLEWSGVAP